MHVLPQLRKLERKYSKVLSVIGVHSAKFDAEKLSSNVREAVVRYEIEHAVVNDAEFAIWQSYGVRVWPTLMLIDPEGKVIGRHEGEFEIETLEKLVDELIFTHELSGTLKRGEFKLIKEEYESTTLSYPGKIAVDQEKEILAISDSNHKRVVITDLDGKIQLSIGNGESPLLVDHRFGFFDIRGIEGPLFDNPQGLMFDKDKLFVADAGTHTIVEIDLGLGTATTLAGTGEQSLYRHEGGEARKLPLSSPYDLSIKDGILYIAMAGFHQLWSMELSSGYIYPYAGTGVENILDDLKEQALLAQPSGIEVRNNAVFFVDSETSSLRVTTALDNGRVVTLIGRGLFDFGDKDGVGPEVKFQHPQGLAIRNDLVYVADSYNNKIKSVALASLEVRTVAGSGEAGSRDGMSMKAQFNEPGGLAVIDNRLYVADTNNHMIRVIDLDSDQVKQLEVV